MSSKNETNMLPAHHLAQLSYAVHLLRGRSVLLLSEDTALAEFIAETGAHVVQVTEREPTAPADRHAVDCHRLPLADLNFDDAVFGAAVIPNLSLIESPETSLAEVRRILAPGGYLLVAAPNPERGTATEKPASPIDYYDLHKMLVGLFPVVQMVGQTRFGGYAVVDLSYEGDDLEVAFNTDILGNESEDIEWFFAICGAAPAEIDPYAVVQVPSSSTDTEALRAALAEARLELSNRGVRIESLEKKLEEELMQSEDARARAVKLAKEFDNERKANTKRQLEGEFSRRSQDIDLQAAMREAKKELRLAAERANSAEAARDEIIERMRADAAELERLRNRLAKMESQQGQAPARAGASTVELQKRLRLAEERARSAEAARDEIIDRMRADAAELERLRRRLESPSTAKPPQPIDPAMQKALRLAEERARSAERARDELIEKMRADAAELDQLRKRVDNAAQPGPDSVRGADAALQRELRRSEERARSAEQARDELIEKMRADAAEIERLRKRIESATPAALPSGGDGSDASDTKKQLRKAEERARLAEAAREEIIERVREETAENDRLQTKIEKLEALLASRRAEPEIPAEAMKKLADADARIAAAEADRDQARRLAEGAATEARTHQSALAALEAALDESRRRLEERDARIAALESAPTERPTAKAPLKTATAASPDADGEGVLLAELESLQAENIAMEQRLATVARERADLAAETQRLENLVRDLIVQLETGVPKPPNGPTGGGPGSAFDGGFDKRDAEGLVEKLEAENAALWGAKAGEHRARVEAELELASKMVEIKKLRETLTAHTVHLKSKDEEIRQLGGELERRNAAIGALKADLERTKDQQMQVATLEGELQSLRWRVDELNARNKGLEDELDVGLQTTDELRAELETLTREAATSKETASKLRETERSLERCMADVDALNAKNQELIQRAEEQIAELRRVSEAQRQSLESAARRERLLDEELEAEKSRGDRLSADLASVKPRIAALEQELTAAQAQRERLQTEANRLRDALDACKQSRREMAEKMEAAKDEAARTSGKLEGCLVELKGAHEQLGELKLAIDKGEGTAARQLAEALSQLDAEKAAASDLRERIEGTERQLAAEQSRVSGLNAALDVLKAELAHESELMRLAGADAARANGDLGALKEKIFADEQRLLEQELEIGASLRVVSSLRQELAQLQRKMKTTTAPRGGSKREASAEAAAIESAALQAKLNELASEKSAVVAEMTRKIEDLESQLNALRSERRCAGDAAGESIAALEARLRELSSERETAQAGSDQARAALEAQLAQIQEASARIQSDLEGQIGALKAGLDAARSEQNEIARKYEVEIDELQTQLSDMQAKNVLINQSKVDMSMELADTIEKVERLQAHLSKNEASEAALRAEIEALRGRLSEAQAAAESAAAAVGAPDLESLQRTADEKAALVSSLTDQLEERERRAAALEKENRTLTEQIREHEVDVSAWNMELKLRSARISQLEKEIEDLKRR